MAGKAHGPRGWRAHSWRLAGWGAAAALLLLPLLAMRLTDAVEWGLADFVVFGALLAGAGAAYELAVRASGSMAYRVAAAIALVTTFLIIWINLAVGIVGSEDNPANLLFGGVLAVGIGGAVAARFRPRGMARALLATAVAQVLVAALVLLAGPAVSGGGSPLDVLGLTGVFAALWLLSAWLFRKAAEEPEPAAAP